jgi:hypothetical protein
MISRVLLVFLWLTLMVVKPATGAEAWWAMEERTLSNGQTVSKPKSGPFPSEEACEQNVAAYERVFPPAARVDLSTGRRT